MLNKLAYLIVLVAMLGIVGSNAFAATVTWDSGGGTDTDISNPANWNPDGLPGYLDDVTISGGTQTISAGILIHDKNHVLTYGKTWDFSGNLTATAGTSIAVGYDPGGTGELNITGGSIDFRGNAYGALTLGCGGSGAVGVVNQSGGSVAVRQVDMCIANGTATYKISGGSLDVTENCEENHWASLLIGRSVGSHATFIVSGSGATSIEVQSLQMGIEDNVDATLSFEFDSGGVTPIDVTGTWTGGLLYPTTQEGGNANLDGILDLVDLGDAVPGTYTVMTADYIKDFGIALAGTVDTSLWSFAIVGDGTGNDELQVTLVPEPATMLLLGIGGLGLIRRKR